jgi:hypothetical protein
MLKSAKELLYSLPIKVLFAGFNSTTIALGQSGWDLSMKQQLNLNGDFELQLAMRMGDRANALYAISHPTIIRRHAYEQCKRDLVHYTNFFSHQYFEIAHVSPGFQFKILPMMNATSFVNAFEPINPLPQERHEDVRDMKFFKVAQATAKDLIVHPDQVPELLEVILKCQQSTQKEIKSRDRSRENAMNYGAKPAHEVQAQILTLAV